MSERIIILGDIHGCKSTLEKVLERVAYTPKADKIICVGDYIDRGDHIKEALDYLICLKEKAGDSAVFLMGNHEEMLLNIADNEWEGFRFFEHPDRKTFAKRKRLVYFIDGCRTWLRNGGIETEKQIFDKLDRAEYDRYLQWLKTYLVYDYRDEEGRFAVTHAGAVYGVELDSIDTKLKNRDCGIYDGPLVICGHSPVEKPSLSGKYLWQTYTECGKMYDLPGKGMLDIDTGCVFGDSHTLTAMVIEGRKFYLESVVNCERPETYVP